MSIYPCALVVPLAGGGGGGGGGGGILPTNSFIMSYKEN